MSKRKFLRAGSAIWLACAALPVAAGEFAPPAEGPVMFRRDQVPLDVETMASLSRQLVPMAAGINRESPASRRSSAQMLALAIALDPANSAAREMIAALRDNRPVAPADPEKITRSQGRVWQYIGWLETREAGPQGQALAACLADVMVASDPGHPRAKELAAAGERGTWTGWVPEIAAYQEKPAAGPPPDEPDEAESPSPLLAAASVATPLWTKAGAAEDAPWVLAPGAIEMAANRSQDPETAELPLSLAIGSGEEGGSYPKMSRMITGLLEKQHGALPTGVSIRIGGKALEASMASEKRQTISAAAAVLANAAVTGREPEAMVIGLVDADGNFTLPAGFWQQLQALRGGDGTRLVLPAAAEEFLPSLLAMEKPQFFLDHQVLLASNFSDLVALVDKTPSLEIESALAKFREIRAKSENHPAHRACLGNPHRDRADALAADNQQLRAHRGPRQRAGRHLRYLP